MSDRMALTASTAVAPARTNSRLPRSYFLMVAAWVLDFQSAGQGQGLAIQAVWLSLYLLGLLLFLVTDRHRGLQIRGLPPLLLCGALYLTVAITTGLNYDQPIYPLMRNGASVFVYLSGAYATARVVMTHDSTTLRKLLALFCAVYAVTFFVIFAIASGGINFSTIRYQIIGTSSIAALGYVTLTLLFRLTYVELAALMANLVILLIAVTRTFLFSFAAQILALLIEFRRVFTPRLVVVGLAGIIVFMGVSQFGGGQVVRWEDRLAGRDSHDVGYQTYFTRIEEWQYMYDDWTSTAPRFMFGAGLAAQTKYHNARAAGGNEENMIGFGHNQHLSLLFDAGLVGGMPILLVQFLQAALSLRFLRRVAQYRGRRSDMLFLGAWGATIVLGNVAANFLAASFVLRGLALWYGIGTGLLLGAQARFDPVNAWQAHPTRAASLKSRPA